MLQIVPMMKLLAYNCILSKCGGKLQPLITLNRNYINQRCLNSLQKTPDNLFRVQLSNEELNYRSSVHIQ